MRSTPAPLLAYFATPGHKKAYCLKLTRNYDSFVVRGTAWDRDLVIAGDGTYYSTSGGAMTDVQRSASLSVDNAEIRCNFDVITSADLQAGRWDSSRYELFACNPDDTSMGKHIIMSGRTGQFTIGRLSWVAELRGRMQSLQQSFGRLVAPLCPHITGDEFCTKDMTAFTHTGTLDSISADGLTMYDSARAEAGPGGGKSISAITNADPAVITTTTAHGFYEGQTVYLSGIVGPVALNGPVTVRSPTTFSFEIAIDTSDTSAYPPYVGSGVTTPMGSNSGYFDGGLITMTSGDSSGLSREVKAYVPGQWTLHEAFPDAAAGDNYTMVAGDDKTATTCRVKFANLANFGGFPFVPGNDHIMQVGRNQ